MPPSQAHLRVTINETYGCWPQGTEGNRRASLLERRSRWICSMRVFLPEDAFLCGMSWVLTEEEYLYEDSKHHGCMRDLRVHSMGVVRLSSTIGPVDAGIVPLLAETYEKLTGTRVEFESAGTGATLEKAKNGTFDMVIVHARALEEQFIADGYGIDRRDFMYNDFMILGPEADPAGIRGMGDAAAALLRIAEAQALFVTRGDLSGTHVKEMEVWEKAKMTPHSDKDEWYHTFSGGNLGNAQTTLFANSRNAYVLMDRATYLIQKNNITLVPLLEGDEILLNFFASIQVNPERFPKVNAEGAKAFIDWLCGDEAQEIIRNFQVDRFGEPLFFPNSDEWNTKQ